MRTRDLRTKLRGKITLLFMTFGLLLAVPAVALADNIQDNIADNVASPLQLTAGDANSDKTAEIKVIGNNSMQDPDAGCNFDAATESLTIKFNTPTGVTATALDGATANAGEMKFTVCGVDQTVKLSASSSAVAGNYTVTADVVTNATGGGTFVNQVSIPITVSPPPDSTAPTVTASAVKGDAPDFTGATTYTADTWTNKDVKVTFTCADNAGGSGLTTTSGNQVKTFTTNTSASGTTASFDGTCVDKAGNTAAASNFGPIKIDKTNPTIDGSASPAANSAGWNNTNVTVSFDCADALSGVASCPADVTLSSDGADQSVTRSATDNAGNSASDTVSGINIDKTNPNVNVTGVSDGATYTLGSVPAAGCSTSDALSGVDANATLQPLSGGPLGSVTATCSGASDKAGNSGSASVTYNVHYNWTGFFRPVDNPEVLNSVKAGQSIPVKFSLAGDQGLNIFAAGSPTSQKITCDSSDPIDVIEETVTAGGSSLSYDASNNQYNYVWKSDKAWAGTCRQLSVKLIDGTTHLANFKFLK